MAGPSFADALNTFVGTGAVKPRDVDAFVKNYQFFDGQRSSIREKYPHSWVAALDNSLYSSSSLKELEKRMDGLTNGDYAYIEQIP